MEKQKMQTVFLIGAKSMGAYGGYETFINKLAEYHENCPDLQYFAACKGNGDGYGDPYQTEGVTEIQKDEKGRVTEFVCHGARCYTVRIPECLGPAQAVYYDVRALQKCLFYIRKERIDNPAVYIMACRIGPFMRHFYKKIQKAGGRVFLNPDGHEWKRAKWNALIRKYWKVSEQIMVRWSDLVICDSVKIEDYIHGEYDGKGRKGADPETVFIPYGAETRRSSLTDTDVRWTQWCGKCGTKPYEYDLIVGRFVPENNYETMIREFMASESRKKLVIITNTNARFLRELDEKLHFSKDPRIFFAGTVYDQELLLKIRENAWAYLHGHEVGGTNPSLLEALGSTGLNLLFDVGFNREVGADSALYWTKENGSLKTLLEQADRMTEEERARYDALSLKRIKDAYSWPDVCRKYHAVFTGTEE